MYQWINGWINGSMDGSMNQRMDQWMDRWIDYWLIDWWLIGMTFLLFEFFETWNFTTWNINVWHFLVLNSADQPWQLGYNPTFDKWHKFKLCQTCTPTAFGGPTPVLTELLLLLLLPLFCPSKTMCFFLFLFWWKLFPWYVKLLDSQRQIVQANTDYYIE